MRKGFEDERLKFGSVLKEVKNVKEKISVIEKHLRYYSDAYPTKNELGTMKAFLKDLKSKKSASTPLEELRKR